MSTPIGWSSKSATLRGNERRATLTGIIKSITITGRVMNNFFKASVLALSVSLSACANINTIGRTTSVPVKSNTAKSGKAIHLDIQQRLVIFDELGNYCAEPSPDGLAAFAAAMGISASNPASAAGAVSGSTGSSAASIGLRTQSITLMRDSMYRICEASANGQIDPTTVTTLLRRSQDLTAVVLAIEQLTGPIAAQQASLHQSSDATASASLVAVGEQLELATAQLERARDRLEAVTTRKAEVVSELAQTEQKIELIKGKLAETSPVPSNSEKVQLNAQMATATSKKQSLTSEQASLIESIRLRTATLEKTQDAHTLVSQKQDTAFASASSGTTGSGGFGVPTARTVLSPDASVAVSGAVKDMVIAVLEQDYMTESCVSLIGVKAAGSSPLEAICIKLITAEIEARRAKSELKTAQDDQKAALLKAQTFKLLPKATLDGVITCITDNGKTDTTKLNLLIAQANPPLKNQHIKLLTGKTPGQIQGILSARANILNPLATAAAKNGVCQ